MSVVERTVEFNVKKEEEPVLVSPSIIGLPVAEQAETTNLTAPIKETGLAWFVRQGQEQRPDVTLMDRLEIARRFWEPERLRGTPFDLAAEYALSRTSIYNIANRLALLFQPRLPGPVAGLKKALSASEKEVNPPDKGQIWPKEESERLRGRLILTGLFPGGMPLRPLEDMLGEVPGVGCSDSTIGRKVKQAGVKADEILRGIDFSQVSEAGVMPAIDETFFDDFPVLFVVEPRSLAICDFYIPDDRSRTADTWAAFLLLLKEDRGLNIIGGMGDAATAYPPAFKTLLEDDGQFREDHFHTLWDVQKLQRKLENSAYRAFKAEYKAVTRDKKKGTAETHQKLLQTQAESRRLAEAYDAFAEGATWVSDALQIVDLVSGEIRDRPTNLWLLDETIAALAQVNHKEVVKMSQRLDDHKPRLLAYLNDLDEGLPHLQTELHAYLQAPDLAQVVLRAVARHWRLHHEVKSNQRRHFRTALEVAQQDVDLWIAGDPFLEKWTKQLYSLLDGVLRASSAVENINSIFKPLVRRKKHFASADSAHNFVALFVLWHNLRVFKEGLRRGKSPFQILGIDLAEKDWRTLLGYPPLP
ncbi:MAG: hypothetical protein GY800_09375 [Planctomycetes bacterium]|nr:hypothetical protein [Planctomycetota bacterium]